MLSSSVLENDDDDDHENDDDNMEDPLTMTASPSSSSSHGVEFTKTATTVITEDTEDSTTTTIHTMEDQPPPSHSPPPPPPPPRRRSSWLWMPPPRLQQVDWNERPTRPSAYRRPSFMEEFAATSGPPQIAALMILIAIGLGCTIGVVPAVMADRFARLQHGWDGPYCSSMITTVKSAACVQGSADAQTAVATSNLVSNVLTFLTSSLLGSWSDQHGRKTLLVAGMAVGSVPPFLLWLMQLLPGMSPWWYYGMHASTGLVNWVAVAFSALADVLPPSMRAPGIGLLMAGFMLGFSLAPILALMLTSIQLSFVSFAVVVAGLVCTIRYVPETLPPDIAAEARRRRQEQDEQEESLHHHHHESPTTPSFFSMIPSVARHVRKFLLRPFYEMSILNRNTFFRLISSLAFFSGMVASGDQILLVYYLEERLGFTNQDVSVMFLIMGIMGLFAQGVLLKPLNDLLGEKNVVAVAFLCGAIDNAMYGLARNKTTIFVALGVAGLTGMAFPTISAIKANNVEPSEQGRIQGALYSLQALASGLGPVALKFVYSQTKNSRLGPGSMFLFASGLYLVAVTIACSLPKDKANARRGCENNNILDGEARIPTQHDLEEYMQLASDSSTDEDDYGTMDSGNVMAQNGTGGIIGGIRR
jgi:MFS transporter, DHA1 family, tetracycline resistance protein